jgi:hypothetical protein
MPVRAVEVAEHEHERGVPYELGREQALGEGAVPPGLTRHSPVM